MDATFKEQEESGRIRNKKNRSMSIIKHMARERNLLDITPR